MKMIIGVLSGVAVGVVATALGFAAFTSQSRILSDGGANDEPLYWVAPMDSNYRRDGPGKSPMGMELVPVFGEAADATEPGVIRIDPDVVNNLGVRTAVVQRSAWQNEIRTVGYVSYDEDQLVHIHPRVAGWVETLYVTAAGNPVKDGQPLYELYSPELVNAQEEMLLAQKRKNRILIDAATARLRALQLSDSFIETLTRTGKVSQTVTFRASGDGVVDNLAIREGFYVQPGTTMMSIGTLDEVWVEAEIFERQAGQVKAGLAVTMRLDYLPGRQWNGVVDYVYPTLDATLRTARIRLRFSNEDRLLKPNMFAQVVIHAQSDTDVLSVPREAVIRTGAGNRAVLALGEGRFQSTAVRLGRVGEQRAEILSGLTAGDRVVTSAQFLLDSESSRSADFQRMHHNDINPSGTGGANAPVAVPVERSHD